MLPSFVSGQNACPPEDCGGSYRYKEINQILADSAQEEYESIVEWLSPNFNPFTFNRLTIEKELGILGAKIKGYEKGFE